jgi:hypothetical protein
MEMPFRIIRDANQASEQINTGFPEYATVLLLITTEYDDEERTNHRLLIFLLEVL